MNKSITIFIICVFSAFIPIMSHANAKDDLYNEAIRKGKSQNYCYQIDCNGKKIIKAQKMCEYLVKKNYVITDLKYDKNNGNLILLEFVGHDNYYHFLHFTLNSKSPAVKPLSCTGKVYLLKNAWKNLFKDVKVAYWNGKIVNGFIDGEGSGIIEDKNNNYIIFEGTFISGIPISSTIVKTYDAQDIVVGDGRINKKFLKSVQYKKPELQEVVSEYERAQGDLKTALTARISAIQSDLPEKYIAEAKQVINNGVTPVLSEDIIGGIVRPNTRFFSGDAVAADKRKTLQGIENLYPKAKEALAYMDLLDGIYLCQTANINKAKHYLNNHFQAMYNSNYETKIKAAQKALAILKGTASASDIHKKLIASEPTINKWANSVISTFENTNNKNRQALKNFFSSSSEDSKKMRISDNVKPSGKLIGLSVKKHTSGGFLSISGLNHVVQYNKYYYKNGDVKYKVNIHGDYFRKFQDWGTKHHNVAFEFDSESEMISAVLEALSK